MHHADLWSWIFIALVGVWARGVDGINGNCSKCQEVFEIESYPFDENYPQRHSRQLDIEQLGRISVIYGVIGVSRELQVNNRCYRELDTIGNALRRRELWALKGKFSHTWCCVWSFTGKITKTFSIYIVQLSFEFLCPFAMEFRIHSIRMTHSIATIGQFNERQKYRMLYSGILGHFARDRALFEEMLDSLFIPLKISFNFCSFLQIEQYLHYF